MSVFALFCWAVLLLCIVAAAWGVGYDQGSTERERMRKLGYLPPPLRDTRRDVFNEYENKNRETTYAPNGRIVEFRTRRF